jgi:TonB family protein
VKAAVAPKYPPLAVSSRISGDVTVRCLVGHSGEVIRAEVLDGHPLLKIAAAEAAQKWKFDRSSEDERMTVVKFEFRLLPEGVRADSEITFLPPNGVRVEQRPVKPPVNYR